MKCKHRFKTEGPLRLKEIHPIRSSGYLWEFEDTKGVITHICVTVPVTQRQYWPEIIQNPTPGVSFGVRIIPPHTMFIQVELRTLQGLLCLFGLRSIDIFNPEIEWIAENDDEQSYLKVNSYRSARAEIPPESIPPLDFDVLARAVFASRKAYRIDIFLSFFRRGVIDMHEQQFIEAIYDFYFVLETAYGAGKFKKVHILESFKESAELREAIEQVLRSPPNSITSDRNVRRVIQEKFSHLTIDEYLEHIVNLRGFLHHHTQLRKRIWNPENQGEYKVDAIILERVVFNAIFSIGWPYFEDPEVLSRYKDQFMRDA